MSFDIQKLRQFAVSDNGLLFDPQTGSIFTTNQIGLNIVNHLREGLAPEQVRERLAEEFDAPDEVLDRDLNDFLSQLVSFGILREKNA